MQIICVSEAVWYQKKLLTYLVPLDIFTAQKTLQKILTLIHYQLLPQILGIMCFIKCFYQRWGSSLCKWNDYLPCLIFSTVI